MSLALTWGIAFLRWARGEEGLRKANMSGFNLSAVEARVLGCLLEKERTTPENYPISINSLMVACNQSTNREPVVGFDEKTVEEAVYSLRQRKLATSVSMAGSRVLKYRHNFLEHYELDPREVALVCVLLLRGAQTPGELRARTERLCGALSLQAVETCLEALGVGADPLVRALEARPGQKERRYLQLLSCQEELPEVGGSADLREEPVRALPRANPLESVENEVAELRGQLVQLQSEFAAFRKQFE